MFIFCFCFIFVLFCFFIFILFYFIGCQLWCGAPYKWIGRHPVVIVTTDINEFVFGFGFRIGRPIRRVSEATATTNVFGVGVGNHDCRIFLMRCREKQRCWTEDRRWNNLNCRISSVVVDGRKTGRLGNHLTELITKSLHHSI